jgi:hypothetical protein
VSLLLFFRGGALWVTKTLKLNSSIMQLIDEQSAITNTINGASAITYLISELSTIEEV